MRHLLIATTLLVAPAAAFGAGPHCAVAPSPQEAAALATAQAWTDPSVSVPAPVDPQAQAARAAPKPPSAAGPATVSPPMIKPLPPPPAPTSDKPLSARAIAAVPALKRIASAGATLLDLGAAHGMRTIFARKGNAFQVFYVVPDGSAAIGGIMWDARGHDVTRDQVAPIPGVIPTVKIGPAAGSPNTPAAVDEGVDPLSLVRKTIYGTTGSPDAPQLWMFVDPFCAYSIRAMHQLEPYVQAGKVRLSVIPLSVLDYEDQGRSTPAAKIMVGEPTDQMVADWVGGNLTGPPPSDATAALARNMAVAEALHLRGTPMLLWKTADGSSGRSDGIPPDLNAVIASLGH